MGGSNEYGFGSSGTQAVCVGCSDFVVGGDVEIGVGLEVVGLLVGLGDGLRVGLVGIIGQSSP